MRNHIGDEKERLLARFRVNAKTRCWDWIGAKAKGYGRLMAYGRMCPAHRLSYELHCEPIPSGMHVLHHCDNPGCIRPEHLFVGTNADNMADKAAKGRQARGIGHASARLTEADVSAIRSTRGMSHRKLAERYGVHPGHIGKIISGKKWASSALSHAGPVARDGEQK